MTMTCGRKQKTRRVLYSDLSDGLKLLSCFCTIRPKVRSRRVLESFRAVATFYLGPAGTRTASMAVWANDAAGSGPRGWLRLWRGSLPPDGRADLREQLSLPTVPGADWHWIGGQCRDRIRRLGAALRGAYGPRLAYRQRRRSNDHALREVRDTGVESLSVARPRRSGGSRRHPGRPFRHRDRCRYLLRGKAGMGSLAGGRPGLRADIQAGGRPSSRSSAAIGNITVAARLTSCVALGNAPRRITFDGNGE
jgi:hypothetical protein